eukprot:2575744-Lingulodinium_polyedra.AAC.1
MCIRDSPNRVLNGAHGVNLARRHSHVAGCAVKPGSARQGRCHRGLKPRVIRKTSAAAALGARGSSRCA